MWLKLDWNITELDIDRIAESDMERKYGGVKFDHTTTATATNHQDHDISTTRIQRNDDNE